MKKREDLHRVLKSYCPNVYYQPPETFKIKYPCIIYSRDNLQVQRADNRPYILECAYSMRYISEEPDDPVIFELALLPFCRHSRHYVADNLHHDAFTIYY